MRSILTISLALALAACAQTPAQTPAGPEIAAPEPASPGAGARRAPVTLTSGPLASGPYAAVSNTAMSITGDAMFEGDTITFDFGHVYESTRIAVPDAEAPLAAGASDSAWKLFGLDTAGPAALEVRRVTAESVNPRAQNGGLCAPNATTYLIIASTQGPTDAIADLRLAAFTGADAPGPNARDSRLCGTFTYAPGTE